MPHHSQSSGTGQVDSLEKNPGEVFSARRKYFFPPFATDFQIWVIFFLLQSEKEQTGVQNWKTPEPSLSSGKSLMAKILVQPD